MYLKIKRLSVILCIILVLFLIGLPLKSKAENNDIDISMDYGFEKHVKMGLHAPITINLDNILESFDGHVQLVVSSVFDTSIYSTSSTTSLFTENYKEKNYLFQKKFSAKAGESTVVSMVVPLINKNNQIKINVFDESDRLIKSLEKVIVAEEYYYCTYIGIISDNEGIENYFNNSDMYMYTNYSIKPLYIKEEDIPYENYGLELFDVLVINENKRESLTDIQKNVIRNWEKNGGILTVLTNEQENLATSWEDFISTDKLRNMTQMQYYKYWSVSSALNSVYINSTPNIFIYIVILIIYLIVVGPVMYLILKKLNKRGYFWTIECVCALLFMMVIVFFGRGTRFNSPFISYFNITSYDDNNIDDTYYLNIQAPYNNEYKLYLDNTYSFVPVYDYFYNYESKNVKQIDDYNIGITYGENENVLTIRNDAPFTKEYFTAEKIYNNTNVENVDININLFMDELTGSVTNNFDYALEDASIYTYNKAVFIGDIKAHETISLDRLEVYTYNPKFKYGITNKAVGLNMNSTGIIKNQEFLLNQKKGLLDLYLDERFNSYTPKGFLVGFKEDINNFDIQLNTGYKAYGISLVEVPFEVNYSQEEMTYLSYVPISNENYTLPGDIMYSEEMVFTYDLGDALKDISLCFKNISYYNDSYYKEFGGRIYLFNRKTQLYDPVDNKSGIVLAEDLKQYLNEDNEVIVKYAEELNTDSIESLIPSVSAVGTAASYPEGKEIK